MITIVSVLSVVVILLVFFCIWLTLQLGTTQTMMIDSNEVISTALLSTAEAMVELERDIKGIEEDLSSHIKELAKQVEKSNK